MRFESPILLVLMLLVPLVLVLPLRRMAGSTIVYSSIRRVRSLGGVSRRRQIGWIGTLRLVALVLLVLALARPQIPGGRAARESSGIDIMLAIDASGSMKGQDFLLDGVQVSRLEAVQSVVRDFIDARPDDRIGLVVFGEYAFTQCPLTLNHDVLRELLEGITFGVAGDTTAIGNALARSILRLKDSKAPSKVVVLLSDGVSNAGAVTVEAASEAAIAFGARVYTVGIGTGEPTEIPFVDAMGVRRVIKQEILLDEGMLGFVAEATGGRYYRASDTEALANIYREIDSLEKAHFDEEMILNWRELFPVLLLLALAVLAIEAVLARTRFLKVP